MRIHLLPLCVALQLVLSTGCVVGTPDETEPEPDAENASITGLGTTLPSSESTVPARFQNLSTRVRVESGDRVAIAGIIVGGSGTKRIVVRALGPSLAAFGITSPLPNPTLELRNALGQLVASNDDWRTNQAAIEATGLAPSNDREAAMVVDVSPGGYTAIVRGADGVPGTGLVETYDIEPGPVVATRFQNMSTRGFVGTGDDVMITGFIIGGVASKRVAMRALGPSLAKSGVPGVLADPTLTLLDAHGNVLAFNDSGFADPEILNNAVFPLDEMEAALLVTLRPGAYTAIVRGNNGGTGISAVELFEFADSPDNVIPVLLVASDLAGNTAGIRDAQNKFGSVASYTRDWYAAKVGRAYGLSPMRTIVTSRTAAQWQNLSNISTIEGHRYDYFYAAQSAVTQINPRTRYQVTVYAGDLPGTTYGAAAAANIAVAPPSVASTSCVPFTTNNVPAVSAACGGAVYATGHELGHTFGLAHTCDTNPGAPNCYDSIMYLGAPPNAILLPSEIQALLGTTYFRAF